METVLGHLAQGFGQGLGAGATIIFGLWVWSRMIKPGN